MGRTLPYTKEEPSNDLERAPIEELRGHSPLHGKIALGCYRWQLLSDCERCSAQPYGERASCLWYRWQRLKQALTVFNGACLWRAGLS